MSTLARILVLAFTAELLSIPCLAATPIPPSPCSATQEGNPVIVTWTLVGGATEYKVFRTGSLLPTLLLATVPQGVSSYQDTNPIPGRIFYYCVVAANADGVSDSCCSPGGYMKTPAPSACSISTSGLANTITWAPVPDAVVYSIYRDTGVIEMQQNVPPYSYTDFTTPGKHTYCVQAGASALRDSDPCCQVVTNLGTLPAPTCQATQDLRGEIVVRWSPVAGATGYHITRDKWTSFAVGAGETTFVDHVVGSHQYGVQAFDDQGGSDPCRATGFAVSPGGYIRMSWATCDPQTANQNFNGPGIYNLVVAVRDLPASTTGHDTRIRIDFPSQYFTALPDAWRFDSAGCHGPGEFNAHPASGGGWPGLGTNLVTTAGYSIDPDGTAELDLTANYDVLTADPNTRYVLWNIAFDHSSSILLSDSDMKTCDNAAVSIQFYLDSQIVLGDGTRVDTTPEADDRPVTWQGPPPVRTQPTTWGHIKGLYR